MTPYKKTENVEEDLKRSGVNNWKTKATNRMKCRRIDGAIKPVTSRRTTTTTTTMMM
jgi:hypothetical protein